MACIQELSRFDHDIEAIVLQLEEIEFQRGFEKRKYAEDVAPDDAMAFLDFEKELQIYLVLLKGQKLAHSVAHAVDMDAPTLEEFRANELQAVQDRMFVLRLTNEDPELEKAANSEVPNVEDEAKKPNAWWTWAATEELGSSETSDATANISPGENK